MRDAGNAVGCAPWGGGRRAVWATNNVLWDIATLSSFGRAGEMMLAPADSPSPWNWRE